MNRYRLNDTQAITNRLSRTNTVFSQLLKNEMGGGYLCYGRYLHAEIPLLGQTSTIEIQDTAFYICPN